MVRTLTAVVMAMCLASVAASAPARAATPTDDTDNKKEYRYELLKDKNGAPLLDEKGKIQILDKMTGMILAVTGSEMAELNSRNEKSLLQRPKDETVKGLEKKNTPPKISIPDQGLRRLRQNVLPRPGFGIELEDVRLARAAAPSACSRPRSRKPGAPTSRVRRCGPGSRRPARRCGSTPATSTPPASCGCASSPR